MDRSKFPRANRPYRGTNIRPTSERGNSRVATFTPLTRVSRLNGWKALVCFSSNAWRFTVFRPEAPSNRHFLFTYAALYKYLNTYDSTKSLILFRYFWFLFAQTETKEIVSCLWHPRTLYSLATKLCKFSTREDTSSLFSFSAYASLHPTPSNLP